VTDADTVGERSRLRLLQLAALTSTCDRFAIAPLLVVIGISLQAPLSAVAVVASGYFLAYGLMQPVWGMISDRIGRVRVMRLALLGATVAGAGSALAPDLLTLGITRVLAGGCFAALIPSTLVYVGDMWPAAVRQRPLSDVLAASSLGVATATAGAGLLADVVGWRAVPAVTAGAAAALWFALARLPEPDREPVTGSPLRSVRRVLGARWGRLVLALVFVEGALVLGVVTFLAPSVQALGLSAGLAGLVAAAFGVGALAWSRLVRSLVGRVSPAGLAAIGGGFLVAGWAVAAVAVNVATVTLAGLCAVALFATGLFLGSAAGTALVAPLAEAGAFDTVFRVALVGAVPLAVLAAVARARYARRV
jgi:MFS family permease